MEVVQMEVCEECIDFEPDVKRLWADDKVIQHVECVHYERCIRMRDRLLKEIKNG